MSRFGARLGSAATLAVLALIVSAIALAYLAQSLFLLLEASALRPAAAAAITGGGAIALAAILGLTCRLLLRPKAAAHPVATARSNGVATDIAADLGALAAQQIVNTTRDHPYGTVGAALAAGVAVGAVPELRKTLAGLFKH
jgi:type VI protein secretion system component VasK